MSRIRGWRWLRLLVGLVVAAIVVGGGYAAYAARAGGPSGYRTAPVETADVERTLELSGTVAQQGRSDLAFGASGTVAAVRVAVGDTVRKGQVLAKLEAASLQAAVTTANASYAAARAQLATDEAAQVDQATGASTSTGTTAGGTFGSSPSSGARHTGGTVPGTGKTPSGSKTTGGATMPGGSKTPGGSTTSGGTVPGGGTSGTAALVARIKAAQSQVEQAQDQLDDARTQLADTSTGAKTYLDKVSAALSALDGSLADDGGLATALAAAKTDCAPSGDADACGDDIQAAIEALGGAQAQVPGTGDGSDLANAQQAVEDAAADVTTAQDRLAAAVDDLDKLLTSAGGSSGSASGGSASPAADTSADTERDSSAGRIVTAAYVTSAAGSSGAASGFSSGGQSVTAATIAGDEASIDQARADLVSARQARAGAVITAPARGTVAQVSVSRGEAASAGSTAITVVAPGLASVQLSVSSSQVTQLKAGQTAHVTPAGATAALSGSVTSVSNVPDSSSSSTTYPVVVTLTRPDAALLVGTTASVDIVTGEAKDVLTVPTSAISNGAVEVLDGDSLQRVRVTTGLVGRTRTVVTDGLKAGQQVVLADLSEALPTGDSTTERGFGSGLRTGVGGLGGGSFAGGFAGTFGGASGRG